MVLIHTHGIWLHEQRAAKSINPELCLLQQLQLGAVLLPQSKNFQ
jgi:hypothetical protein